MPKCRRRFYLQKQSKTFETSHQILVLRNALIRLQNCTDVDECASHAAQCEHRCVNTIGSYFCVCEDNYILYPGDGASCQKRDAEPPRVPNQRLSSAVGVSFLFMVLTGAAGFGLYKYRMRVRSTSSVELALLCNLVCVAASFAVQYLFLGYCWNFELVILVAVFIFLKLLLYFSLRGVSCCSTSLQIFG